jgi:hypothetical protein
LVKDKLLPVVGIFHLGVSKNHSALELDAGSGGAAVLKASFTTGGDPRQRY